jgi:hypothetical protein
MKTSYQLDKKNWRIIELINLKFKLTVPKGIRTLTILHEIVLLTKQKC